MPADYLMRMSGLEAQVGLAQLDRYPQIISNRRATAEFYDKALADLPGLRRPPLVEGVIYSYYAVRTERPIDLMAAVLKRGVQLGRWVETSIPQMPAYRDRPGNRLPCPVAREIARTEVNLPICLGVKGAAKVARVIREALCR